MFPIEDRDIIAYGLRFGQETWYSDFHLGLDVITKKKVPILTPEHWKVIDTYYGPSGGNTVLAKGIITGNWYRSMHCNRFIAKPGDTVQEGVGYALVGNTGLLTSGPHLHMDITKGWVDEALVRAGKMPRSALIDPMTLHAIKDSKMVHDKDRYYITRGRPGLSKLPKKSVVGVNRKAKTYTVMQIPKLGKVARGNYAVEDTFVWEAKYLVPKENEMTADQFHQLAKKERWERGKINSLLI